MKPPKLITQKQQDAAAIAKKNIAKLARAIDQILTNPETPKLLWDAVSDCLTNIVNETDAWDYQDLDSLVRWLPKAIPELAEMEQARKARVAAGTEEEYPDPRLPPRPRLVKKNPPIPPRVKK